MKKHLLGTLVGMVLLTVLCLNTMAVDGELSIAQTFSRKESSQYAGPDALAANVFGAVRTASLEELSTTISLDNDVRVNGISIARQTVRLSVNNTNYISIRPVVKALFPNAKVTWAEGLCSITADGLVLTARPGDLYLMVNGRYLYIPDGIVVEDHSLLAPVRTLCTALGADVELDSHTNSLVITDTGTPPLSGEYDSDSVYWLARVINAESGNQPLIGKIAVGTVILNRVEDPLFPNSIYDVIFDNRYGSYQFSTVPNGAIYQDPNEESIIAAKLCLDGARAAGSSLYFNTDGLNCWASNNRPYVMTIAGHDFYL